MDPLGNCQLTDVFCLFQVPGRSVPEANRPAETGSRRKGVPHESVPAVIHGAVQVTLSCQVNRVLTPRSRYFA